MENIRDEKGRIKPGHTLNPGGRPRKKRFEDYFTETEIEALILRIKQEGLNKSDILKMTVEQIFGKPKQPITGGDEDDNPVSITFDRTFEKYGSSTQSAEGNCSKQE